MGVQVTSGQDADDASFETAFGGVAKHQGVGARRGFRACVQPLVRLVEPATLSAGPVQCLGNVREVDLLVGHLRQRLEFLFLLRREPKILRSHRHSFHACRLSWR